MNNRAFSVGVGIALLACLAGCGRSSTEPAPYYKVTLDVDLSQQSAGGTPLVELVSTVRNVGSLAVRHAKWYGGPYVSLYDSAGRQLSLRNECVPFPDAPAEVVSLEPGASLTATVGFDGTIWQGCEAQQIANGPYQFVIEFPYWTADGETATVAVTKDFTWGPTPVPVAPK